MSEQIISHKIERTCDGCEKKYEYESVGMADQPAVLQEVEDWTQLTRKIWNGREWIEMVAQALGLECVQKCATKMEIMIQTARAKRAEQERQADDIDLNALRATSVDPLAN